jgi:hypothetical protein
MREPRSTLPRIALTIQQRCRSFMSKLAPARPVMWSPLSAKSRTVP